MEAALGIRSEKHPVDVACEEMCPNMSIQQRTIGYVTTFCVGCLFNLFSWAAIVSLGVPITPSFECSSHSLFCAGKISSRRTNFLRYPVRCWESITNSRIFLSPWSCFIREEVGMANDKAAFRLSFLFRVLNCPGERGNEDRNSALFSIK
jgi:hypothetical protein